MLFKRRFGASIVDGSITMTFRAWSRPQARSGSRQRFGLYDGKREATGFLEIDAVDVVPVASITKAQARRAGFQSADALIEELRRSSRTQLRGNSKVYRVLFHFRRAPDERARLAADDELSREDIDAMRARLERMDTRRAHGPWTERTLRLIARRPAVAASRLAGQLGLETAAFKANVRELKALGLTISLEVGYRLSARGRAFVAASGDRRRRVS